MSELQCKTCNICLVAKPVDSFARKRDAKDGRAFKCKSCAMDYIVAWRIANHDSVRAKAREKYYSNPAPVIAQASKWQRDNVERTRIKNRKWQSKNRDACATHIRNRRAKQKRAEGTHTKADVLQLLRLQKEQCAICNKKLGGKYHVDHIQPIFKGGANHKLNLQILCPFCNESKGAKDPIEYMRSRGFLL